MAATSDRMQIPEYVKRELSEVYLLMDHIAGRKDKTLDEALASKITGGRQITLDELCGVAWPPLEQDRGKVLALVLTAKDRLSRAAYPATGYSVAFTYLTLAEYVRSGGWGQRLFGRSNRTVDPQSNRSSAAAPPNQNRSGASDAAPDGGEGAGATPIGDNSTMVQFARDAFPGLAATRKSPFHAFVWALPILLLVTCLVSWDLAVGQRLLADYRWLSSHPEVLISDDKIPDECKKDEEQDEKQGEKQGEPTARKPCARALARQRVAPLAISWIGWQPILRSFTCNVPSCASDDVNNVSYQNVVFEQTRVIVTTLNFNVLPLLLGGLAATAAALRNTATKIARQELEPRDLAQVWPRVLLGAFLGSMIGLFISPGPSNGFFTVAADSEPTSTVALSPAAFAFLAGFATGRIFHWLDSLVEKIFAVAIPKP